MYDLDQALEIATKVARADAGLIKVSGIAVSSGFSLSDPEVVVNPNWDILIIGRAIVDAVDPAQATRQLLDLLDRSNP